MNRIKTINIGKHRNLLLWGWKWLLGFSICLCTIFNAPAVFAQETNWAGLVIQFNQESSPRTECIGFTEPEILGTELLNLSGVASTLKLEVSGEGTAVCRIDSTGCDYPAQPCFCQCQDPSGGDCRFWNYWQLQSNAWQFLPLGAASHRVHHGDVVGWSWGLGSTSSGSEQPKVVTFAEICPQAVTATPTATVTPTPTETPTGTLTPTGTITTTNTLTGVATITPSATTPIVVPTSPLPTPTFTHTPSFTPPPVFTETPTFTPWPTETFTPAPTPTPMGTYVVAPAIVEFVAEPGAVVAGQSTMLRWNLARTNSAVITHAAGQDGIDPTTGIMAVSPITTTRYTLTASGAGGQVSRSITVTVQLAPTATPLTETVIVSETTVLTEGVTLVEPIVEAATHTPEIVVQLPPSATAAPVALNLTPGATLTPETDDALAFDRNNRTRTVLLYGLFALGVLAPIGLIVAALVFRRAWRRR